MNRTFAEFMEGIKRAAARRKKGVRTVLDSWYNPGAGNTVKPGTGKKRRRKAKDEDEEVLDEGVVETLLDSEE